MECLEAQAIVSATIDHEPVDAALLDDAKRHCKSCPECTRFVRAQVRIREAGLPTLPEGIEERIVAAVGPLATTATPVAADARVSGAKVGIPSIDIDASPATAEKPRVTLAEMWNHPRHRRALVAWSSAAAVVFLVSGALAVRGVRSMLLPEPESVKTMVVEGSSYSLEATAGDTAAMRTEMATTGAGTAAIPLGAASGTLVFEGTVYRAAGVDSSIDQNSLSRKGAIDVALTAGEEPVERDVLGSTDSARVFIEGPAGLLVFDMVTRNFDGRTYRLRASDKESLDQAISLPAGIDRPDATDGSPTFEELEGSEGIYVLTGSDASEGIALPPGTTVESGDWTWWTPES